MLKYWLYHCRLAPSSIQKLPSNCLQPNYFAMLLQIVLLNDRSEQSLTLTLLHEWKFGSHNRQLLVSAFEFLRFY